MPRATDLYSRWSLEMRRARLFAAGDRVGIAVSGGPDSVLLLDFMCQLGRQLGFRCLVVHFNHHLREAESDADENFVASEAARRDLEYLRSEANVARIARERRRNLEATGRELRYRFFFSLVNQGKVDRVATAHTENDQAETVLLRLLRGADLRGLGGIFPRLESKVVRPFLGVTRREVEKEIATRGLAFRVDRSNLDLRFTRNKIRRELLPLLEKEFNPAIVSLLKDFASRARDDETYLEQAASEQARPWRIREGDEERIPISALAQFPPAISRRVLRQMIGSVRRGPGGFTAGHLQQALRLVTEGSGGKTVILPGGVEARKELGYLVVRPARQSTPARDFCFEITPPAEVAIPLLGVKFRLRIVENPPSRGEKTYNKQGTLDFEKLGGSLVLRNWQPGDRFHPLGSRRAHKLKDLLKKLGTPEEQRRLWPVLVSGEETLWVRNFPPSADFAASPLSRQLLIIEEEPCHPPGPGAA
ncbi:MAG TPA: tRNA lysidine(34) synthetase TilS [Terriglobia bacterium]|nr:tRNA lysidine(34) synthetase TilS [Terriglobia bacterium]